MNETSPVTNEPISSTTESASAAKNVRSIRVAFAATVISLFVFGGFMVREAMTAPGTFLVNTFSDSMVPAGPTTTQGTLRQAIEQANANNCISPCTINFANPGTYTPSFGPFPSIVATGVVIDGFSAPGAVTNTAAFGSPLTDFVNVAVTSSSGTPVGFDVQTNNVTIRGVAMSGFSTAAISLNGTGNSVKGCHIGTNTAGSGLPVGPSNGLGVRILAPGNTVGGATPADFNLVSANTTAGIVIDGSTSTGNTVIGNYVGTDRSVALALANGVGVHLTNLTASNNIGTTTLGNVISGNTNAGLLIDTGATSNTVAQNRIGTTGAGTAALSNGGLGAVEINGANGNTIGGTVASAGNLISGNSGASANLLIKTANNNVVKFNNIGGNLAGTGVIPGPTVGIQLSVGADGNTIGAAGQGNTIVGHSSRGVNIIDFATQGNQLTGNRIGGIGAFRNGDGVYVQAPLNRIVNGNEIGPNLGNGVVVDREKGTQIFANSIHDNVSLGIDLVNTTTMPNGVGPTANDATDADASGGNNYQNYATITSATTAGTTFNAKVSLDSSGAAGTVGIRVHFYIADTLGQGKTYLGASGCLAPSFSNSAVSFTPVAAPTAGDKIVTTATNYSDATCATANDGTSEFLPLASAATVVVETADLGITKTGPASVNAGQSLTYTITASNASGPFNAQAVTVSDVLPAGTTFSTLTPPVGWTCSTPAVGANGTVTCTIPTLTVGASATFTLVVNAPVAGGLVTNTATISSSTPEPATPVNPNTASVTTTVVPQANLSLIKTDSPDPVGVGQNLTYSIVVSNGGPSAATAVTLTDTLPAGVTFVSAASTQGTCTGTTTVTCSIGTLTNGASATATIVVKPTASGTLTNTASVTAAEGDPNIANNTATAITVVNPAVDLAITKTDAPDPVLLGGNINYTISVVNNGPSAATNTIVTDALPASVTFVSATPSQGTCSGTTTVTCNLGTVGSGGGSASIVIVVTAMSPGTITNTASVTATETDTNTANNTATTTTAVSPAANLSVTKTDSPDPVGVGQNLTYTIVTTNAGPSPATNVTLTDALPAGVTFVSASSTQGTCSGTTTVTCSIGTLANGAAATATIVVTPTAPGTLTNTATVTAAEGDPNTANNSATAITVVNPAVDLAITKTDAPDPVLLGGNINYTISVVNNGPSAATNTIVTDALPASVTFVSATPSQGACSGTTTVTCNLGTVGSGGGSASIVIVVTAMSPGTISNTASVTATETDTNTANNTATTTTAVGPAANLSVTKTDSPDPVGVGQNLTYTIVTSNAGPSVATGVTLVDTIPAGVTFISATASQGACVGTGPVTCNLGTLGLGGSATVTIVVQPTAPGTILNQVSVSATEGDPNTANNSASASTIVGASANLSVTKTDSPDPVNVGQNLTYTIVVANAGPSPATNVTLTDALPAGVTFVSASSTQGTCSGITTVTCSIGTLANGAAATATIVVNPTSPGTLTNTATVSAAEGDPNTANNSASAITVVGASADVKLAKTASPASIGVGNNVTYTVLVSNAGPSNATNVMVTDVLPAQTMFVSASSTQGSCSGTSTVTCSLGALANGASATVTIVATATSSGTVSNTATVTATEGDPNTSNNSSTATSTFAAALCPGVFSNMFPPNGSTEIPVTGTLRWSNSNADSYQVFFGLAGSGCSTLVGTTASNTFRYPTLRDGVSYEYKIVALKAGCPTVASPCNSFTTATRCNLIAPTLLEPSSGARVPASSGR